MHKTKPLFSNKTLDAETGEKDWTWVTPAESAQKAVGGGLEVADGNLRLTKFAVG